VKNRLLDAVHRRGQTVVNRIHQSQEPGRKAGIAPDDFRNLRREPLLRSQQTLQCFVDAAQGRQRRAKRELRLDLFQIEFVHRARRRNVCHKKCRTSMPGLLLIGRRRKFLSANLTNTFHSSSSSSSSSSSNPYFPAQILLKPRQNLPIQRSNRRCGNLFERWSRAAISAAKPVKSWAF